MDNYSQKNSKVIKALGSGKQQKAKTKTKPKRETPLNSFLVKSLSHEKEFWEKSTASCTHIYSWLWPLCPFTS